MIGRIIFKAASKLSGKQKAGLAKAIRASALKRGARKVGSGVKRVAIGYANNVRRRQAKKAAKVLGKLEANNANISTLRTTAKTLKDEVTLSKTSVANLRSNLTVQSAKAEDLSKRLANKNNGLIAFARKSSLKSTNKDLAITNKALSSSEQRLANLETSSLNAQSRVITAERQSEALLKQYKKLSARRSTGAIVAGGVVKTSVAVGAGIGAYSYPRNNQDNAR